MTTMIKLAFVCCDTCRAIPLGITSKIACLAGYHEMSDAKLLLVFYTHKYLFFDLSLCSFPS